MPSPTYVDWIAAPPRFAGTILRMVPLTPCALMRERLLGCGLAGVERDALDYLIASADWHDPGGLLARGVMPTRADIATVTETSVTRVSVALVQLWTAGYLDLLRVSGASPHGGYLVQLGRPEIEVVRDRDRQLDGPTVAPSWVARTLGREAHP